MNAMMRMYILSYTNPATCLSVGRSEAVFHFCLRRNGHFVSVFRQHGDHLVIGKVSISGFSSKTFFKTAKWQIYDANRGIEKDILYWKETDFGHKYIQLFMLKRSANLINFSSLFVANYTETRLIVNNF